MLMYSLTMLTWLEPTGIPHGVGPAEHPPVPGGVGAPLVPIPCCQRPQELVGGLAARWSSGVTPKHAFAALKLLTPGLMSPGRSQLARKALVRKEAPGKPGGM